MKNIHYDGPIVLAIMDGVGLSVKNSGNAVKKSHTEFLDNAMLNYLNIPLGASGKYVGVPNGVMGNSEIGHNTIGSGQIIKQGIEHINSAFSSGEIWQSKAWQKIIENIKNTGGTLHFSGIFSDGGVHSDIAHLEKLIVEASKKGIKKIRIHCVFDGRDVSPQSEPKYIIRLETFLKGFGKDCDYKIASGGGRMVIVADRYESDWQMVELGWNTIVHGKAPHSFYSATDAIAHLRKVDSSVSDQYLPAFVIIDKSGAPIGKVKDGDSFLYFDFRADRAIEFAKCFELDDFPYFHRGTKNNSKPNVVFAGLTEYDSDLHLPKNQLIAPISFKNSLSTTLANNNISSYAVSETVKFGHITYYFNGNSYKKHKGEVFEEIPSFSRPFNECPWMKSAEIADAVIKNCDKYRFIRCNFPGGDMVGHFGELEPTIIAMESIDLALVRIAKKVDELGGMMIITADHGNAEELLDENGIKKTSHTTNPVPCIFYDNTVNQSFYTRSLVKSPGLANLAPTIAYLLGVKDLPDSWCESLITML